jgi:hypothetical protein
MYAEDALFTTPPDDVKLWRYMDVTKLLALLTEKCLFFARSDRLSDCWEGALSKKNIERRDEALQKLKESQPLEYESYREFIPQFYRQQRRDVYVSCWHESAHESDAMWKLYLKSDEGIAVQTTCERLKDSVRSYDKPVFIGRVQYLNYDSDVVPEHESLARFMYKRVSFAHEREVRALIWAWGDTTQQPLAEYGISVPVELDSLIEAIYLSPRTPEWMSLTVQNTLDKFGIKDRLRRSSLEGDPVF